MVAGDGADGAANVDDFSGSKIGRKGGDHAAARYGNLNVAEAQKGMAAEIDFLGSYCGDRTRGVDGGIALNENHAGDVSGSEMSFIGLRRSCAPLGRDEAVALELIRELLERGRLEARENERRLDRLERGAGRQAGSRRGFGGKAKLLCGRLRCRWLGRRIQHVLNGCDAGDGLFGEDT